MHVLGDLLARDRRSAAPALVTRDGRERSYRDLLTNTYRAANLLRHLGARRGSTIAVAPAADLQPVLAVLGAGALGAAVRFDPDAGIDAGDRVVLVEVADESAFDPRPGTNLAAFGGSPSRADTTHWEKQLWSENPATPPVEVDPHDPLFLDADERFTHGAVVRTAATIVEEHGLTAASRVGLAAPLSPAAVTVGLVAPLSCGGTAVVTDPASAIDSASADAYDLLVVGNGWDEDPPADRGPPRPPIVRCSAIDL